MAMMLGQEYSINQFIKEYKEETLSFDTLHYKEIINKINNDGKLILLSDPILLKYDEELATHIIQLNLTDAELNKYKYNPKLLSYDLYNTTELWFMILRVNELYSTTQFNLNPLLAYDAAIIRLINTVINLEQPFIDENLETIRKEM